MVGVDPQIVTKLEGLLGAEPVDEDYDDLRIQAVRVESTADAPVDVRVSWTFHGRAGQFSRPFDPDEVQMLADPTPGDPALAFANWVRAELVEHISELIGAGEFGEQ